MPWNHVECGSHYTRAMSSWSTLLAATGFKPDLPAQTLAILPGVPGDFHAPWVTASGFGRLTRRSHVLGIDCIAGALKFKKLRLNLARANPAVRLSGRALEASASRDGSIATLEFPQPLTIHAGETLAIG
jgi:hypothetical protein